VDEKLYEKLTLSKKNGCLATKNNTIFTYKSIENVWEWKSTCF